MTTPDRTDGDGLPIPLADHDEIGRKVFDLPWAVQKAIVTIAAHCVALKDEHETGPVSDLAGCISHNCMELADALRTAPQAPDAGEETNDITRCIQTIETAYSFHFGAIPLTKCGEWIYLKELIAVPPKPAPDVLREALAFFLAFFENLPQGTELTVTDMSAMERARARVDAILQSTGDQPTPQVNGELRALAELFAESAHETWTREEVVNVIEDVIRLRTGQASTPVLQDGGTP